MAPSYPPPPVFADLPPYSGSRSAKSGSDLGSSRSRAMHDEVVIEHLDVPAQCLQHRLALCISQHLSAGAVPPASLRLKIDKVVRIGKVELGDGDATDLYDIVPHRHRQSELADDVEQHHLEPA